MMICKKCGTENDDRASVCAKCGKPLASGSKPKNDMFDFSICSGLMLVFCLIAVILLLVPGTKELKFSEEAVPEKMGYDEEIGPLKTIEEKMSVPAEKQRVTDNITRIEELHNLEADIRRVEELVSGMSDDEETLRESLKGKIDSDDALIDSDVYQFEGMADAVITSVDIDLDNVLRDAMQKEDWTALSDQQKDVTQSWDSSDVFRLYEKKLRDFNDETVNKMLRWNELYLFKTKEKNALENAGPEVKNATDENGQNIYQATVDMIAEKLDKLEKDMVEGIQTLKTHNDANIAQIAEYIEALQNGNKEVVAAEKIVAAEKSVAEYVNLANKKNELEVGKGTGETKTKGINDLKEDLMDAADDEKAAIQKDIDKLEKELAEVNEQLKPYDEKIKAANDKLNEAKKKVQPVVKERLNEMSTDDFNQGALRGVLAEHRSMKDTAKAIMMVFVILMIISFALTIVAWVTKFYRLRLIIVIVNAVLALFAFIVPLITWTFESKWPHEISRFITYGVGFSSGYVIVLVMAIATLFTGFAYFADDLFGKKN